MYCICIVYNIDILTDIDFIFVFYDSVSAGKPNELTIIAFAVVVFARARVCVSGVCVCEGAETVERERERQTDRQTDRQRERQTDRQTETEKNSETDRQTERTAAERHGRRVCSPGVGVGERTGRRGSGGVVGL